MIVKYQKSFSSVDFNCENSDLNSYIKTIASQDIKRNLCTVWVKIKDNKIIGFYTLSPFALLLSELPEPMAKKFPKGKHIPCWLIGKMARDKSVVKQGVGRELILDALHKVKEIGKIITGYCVIVDSKDMKSDAFYKSYGFKVLDETKNERRYYLPLNAIPDI